MRGTISLNNTKFQFQSIIMTVFFFLCASLITISYGVCETQPSSDTFKYNIGPRDILEITILTSATSMSEDKTARYKLSVNSFGEIAIPLAGKIKVEGLTSAKLEDAILKKLKKF